MYHVIVGASFKYLFRWKTFFVFKVNGMDLKNLTVTNTNNAKEKLDVLS